ncbi:MAG: hypothetical protein ACI855_001638 [Myxococcota bacterium]|jgi:hypothetical protein
MLGFLFGCGATPNGIDTSNVLDERIGSFEYSCDAVDEQWTLKAHLTNTGLASVPVEMSSSNNQEMHELNLEFRDQDGNESYALNVTIVSLLMPGTGQTSFSCNDRLEIELLVP